MPRPICPKLMRQTCQRATDCHQLGFRPAAQSTGSAAPLLSSMVAGAGCMNRARKGAELRLAGRAEIGRLARNSELGECSGSSPAAVFCRPPVSSRFPAGFQPAWPASTPRPLEGTMGGHLAGFLPFLRCECEGGRCRLAECAHAHAHMRTLYICACACVGAALAAHHGYSSPVLLLFLLLPARWDRNPFPVFPCRSCVPCVMWGRTFISQSSLNNNSLGSNMILTNGIPWSCIPCPLQPPWAHPLKPASAASGGAIFFMPATPGSMSATPGSMPATPGSMPATPGSMPATPGSMPATPGSSPPQAHAMHPPPGTCLACLRPLTGR
jgi:hypothetical protein